MTAPAPSKAVRFLVPLFPMSQQLDWIGPKSVFDSTAAPRATAASFPFKITTLIAAETKEPISCSGGLRVLPDMTLDEAEKEEWDGILLPGGAGARPWEDGNGRVKEFLLRQVPKTPYIFTVCTGSWLLASLGLLRGQRATSNKAAYKEILENTKDQGVDWVPEARWVVDGKFWTSSGVTAGIDMAVAVVQHFISQHIKDEKQAKDTGDTIMGILEFRVATQDEDPWGGILWPHMSPFLS